MNLTFLNACERGKKSQWRCAVADFVRPSVPDLPDSSHVDPYFIAHCGFCDDDGYRNSRVCDHVDHSAAVERGMAKVRAALTKEAM